MAMNEINPTPGRRWQDRSSAGGQPELPEQKGIESQALHGHADSARDDQQLSAEELLRRQLANTDSLERAVRRSLAGLYVTLTEELEAQQFLAIEVALIRVPRLDGEALALLRQQFQSGKGEDLHELLVCRETLVALAGMRRDKVLAAMKSATQDELEAVARIVDGLVSPRPGTHVWADPRHWRLANALRRHGMRPSEALADMALGRLACLVHAQDGGDDRASRRRDDRLEEHPSGQASGGY